MEKYGYGADVGGTTVKIGFFTSSGELLEKWEIDTDTASGGEAILPDVAESIKGHMAKKGITAQDVLGVGVGVPGPVADGVVNGCVNLGWGVVDVEKMLSGLLGMNVKCSNDANVAALGELWMGGGKGSRQLVMITLGTGVGGGIVVDGKIVNGSHGAGGEVGHIRINDDETVPCGCGNCGCFEQYASATGLVRTAKRMLEESDAPSKLRDTELTSKNIWDLSKDGDTLAREITDSFCDSLGKGCAVIAAVVDPEIIVLGGGVSKAGQQLASGAQKAFLKYAFHGCRNTRFELARLGNDAGIYGCMYMLL